MFAGLAGAAGARATNQRSPRRGSGIAVIDGVVPVAVLVVDRVDMCVGVSGVAFERRV
jgi:hypothetical protein